ncbi:polysaccharide deacetylase family protein [Streptomyces sp. NPDC093591]|uniref:polysaccharide deacetylase family protein n=1 Tax=Streptomyces sp. NPDC093591 TaxID=3366044 RepID=UPI003819FFD7
MAFTGDGGLRVSFDCGEVGPSGAGAYMVTVPKKTVTPWLSGFGKRAQQQPLTPSRSLDLGTADVPEPAVPSHTASDDDTDCKKVKCVALTFDDGPAVPETATLLTYLAQYKARATFFTTGQNVAAHPDLVRAAARAGNEIGNHSWNHPDLTKLTPEQIASRLNRTNTAVKAAPGQEPTLFRPPYGAINTQVRAATRLSPVLWDVDTEDWEYPRRRQGRPDGHGQDAGQRRRPDARHPPHLGGRRPSDPAHPDRPRLPLRHRQPPARHPLTGRPPAG